MTDQTVEVLLSAGDGAAPAIIAPDMPPLTYAGLRDLVARTRGVLNSIGIAQGDRVALVMPNGPEMATSFLSVACAATAAPLNPSFKLDEFEFALRDLQVRAVIVKGENNEIVRTAAERCEVPVISLVPGKYAGDFTLTVPPDLDRPPADARPTRSEDIALVLHTSGTTARPKIVPLSHGNVTASARNIRSTLLLTTNDVCLNIMPLFHIHGLIAAVLSSMSAGASVICTPGLNGFRFFSWLREFQPTWYTAVPTMHQTLLELAPRFKEVLASSRLRFLRSSSAPLLPQVMAGLEQAFGVPVLEAYGMTEAAHQMTCNPLPPGDRVAGTVGVAAGPEVAIMGDDGRLLPAGEIGEIVIRGDNVTRGYENNPDANRTSFTDGWFRTGDQGTLDSANYLRLTGRLKEIINRAGEKISPIEVDKVLMDYPDIRQVVTFAMPSRLFGEEVAAAVVLREGTEPDAEAIRAFAASRLAPFKVPQRVVFLDEIPKGVTGKLQRVGLAERLGVRD